MQTVDSNNKLLKTVYEDPSLMINEMTPQNFFVFLQKMSMKTYHQTNYGNTELKFSPHNHIGEYVHNVQIS